MELHQVRYFLAAAESLNFTRAAEQCHVSQPALTTAIKKLEQEMGAPLFHREGKRILLSELGELVRPHLSGLLGQAETARDVADNFRLLNQAPLKVGVMATIGPLRLSRFLTGFQRGHPGIELALSEGGLDELTQRLDGGELDLAVLSAPEPLDAAFRTEPIYDERYVVVFPPGHRFEALNAVALAEVSGEPYVDRLACELRELVAATARERQVELYAKFRSEREDWVQGMVMAGIGFAFMPECSVTFAGLLSRPLIEPEVARTVLLVAMPGRPHSPAAAAFVRAVRAHDWPG